MGDDYYVVLELTRTATEADIKKAYKKMALRWHPDKNRDNKEEADRRFKEISEAYEVLSDAEKRQIYDVYGKAGLENGSGGAGSSGGHHHHHYHHHHHGFPDFNHGGFHSFVFRDPQEVFREFFGSRDPFADFLFAEPFAATASRHNHYHQHQQQQQQQQQQHPGSLFQSSFIGFPTFQLHDPFFSAGFGGSPFGGAQLYSFSSGSTGVGPHTQFRSSSTSTRVVNGRQIVTKKVVENGVETVTVTENGVVTQRTVNGRNQPIEGSAGVPGGHGGVGHVSGGRSSAAAVSTAGGGGGVSSGRVSSAASGSSARSGSGGGGGKRFNHQAGADSQKKQRRGDPKRK